MKIWNIIFLLFLILQTSFVNGQFVAAEVTPTQEKTIINGHVYYIHTVQKGQTLYSISKAYGVSQEDILRENAAIQPDTLKEGTPLRIPVIGVVQQQEPVDPAKFYEHRVRRRQTVYSLARRYDVSEELIYQYNPWARAGIKEDQILLIPKAGEAGFQDVPLQEYGQEDSTALAEEVVNAPCVAEAGATYDVALMLPLFADYIRNLMYGSADSLKEEGSVIQQSQTATLSREFTEFYEGILLAADSMRTAGMSINLHVYDTDRDNSKILGIQKEIMEVQPDLIIGPVYTENMNIVSPFTLNLDVNIVSPLSTNTSLLSGNPRLFQVVPSKDAESKALVDYLMGFSSGKYILIRDSVSMNDSWRFKQKMLERLSQVPEGQSRFVEFALNDSLLANLGNILSRTDQNYVVVFSDSEPDVGELVTRLYMVSGTHPIVLFGQPVWQVWKTLELSFLHKLQLTLFTPFHVDYSNPRVKAFLRKCRQVYGFEPYEISGSGYNFCMLGYDVGIYFLSALNEYGRNFQNCIGFQQPATLLSDYRFFKAGEGGFLNEYVNFIRYNPDLTVESIKPGN